MKGLLVYSSGAARPQSKQALRGAGRLYVRIESLTPWRSQRVVKPEMVNNRTKSGGVFREVPVLFTIPPWPG